MSDHEFNAVMQEIAEVKGLILGLLVAPPPAPKEWFTTAEVAEKLDRSEFTVREWCRNGRINAKKRATGRGKSKDWMIHRSEIERIRNEGLLAPPGGSYRHVR